MAYRLSGLVSGGVFVEDMGDMTLQGATGSIVIVFTVKSAGGMVLNSWNEEYYPNGSGEVLITGLAEVMEAYLQGEKVDVLFNPDSGFRQLDGYVVLEMALYKDGAATGDVWTQWFYQANARTNVFPGSYVYFLNRFRERMVMTDQLLTMSYIYRGQTLRARVAYYMADGSSAVKTVALTASGMTQGRICMRQYRPSYMAGMVSATAERLIYIVFELMSGGSVIDWMKCTFDHVNREERTGFVFKNMFGVLEHVIFTGQNKRSSELEGSYSWIGRKYRKMHTDLTTSHTVCSGWIDEETHESVKDAIKSDDVRLCEGLVLGDLVTVTDIDLDYATPRTSPMSAYITYRVADKVQERFRRTRGIADRVFDDTFDHTFN